MAKTNRFYLFIAALIWTHSYDASAAVVDCAAISYDVDLALDCYANMKQDKVTYDTFQFYGISEGMCDGDFVPYNADGEPDHDAICPEVHKDGLEEACCHGDGDCVKILDGTDTCQGNEDDNTGGGTDVEYPLGRCADEYAQSIVAELDPVIESLREFLAIEPSEEDLNGLGIYGACNDWSDPNDDGIRYCTDIDEDQVAKRYCEDTGSYYEYCMLHYNNKLCYSEEPTCGSGTYLNSSRTMCLVCPDYVHYDGSEDNTIIWSDVNSEQINDCYVPKNTSIENDIGAFVFDFDCNYSGS